MNLRLGIDFFAGMVTGLVIGYWLDRWFGTHPFLMIVFIILGFASSCRTLFKTINESTAKENPASTQNGRPKDKGDT